MHLAQITAGLREFSLLRTTGLLLRSQGVIVLALQDGEFGGEHTESLLRGLSRRSQMNEIRPERTVGLGDCRLEELFLVLQPFEARPVCRGDGLTFGDREAPPSLEQVKQGSLCVRHGSRESRMGSAADRQAEIRQAAGTVFLQHLGPGIPQNRQPADNIQDPVLLLVLVGFLKANVHVVVQPA